MRSVIFAVSTALTVLLSACTGAASSVPVNTVSSVSASTSITTSSEVDSAVSESASSETGNIQTGLVREQTLDSTEGLIHYSYYLPEDYDPTRKYPMMVVMPGYNMMWFGESLQSKTIFSKIQGVQNRHCSQRRPEHGHLHSLPDPARS